MNFVSVVNKLNAIIWAMPVILLLLIVSIYYLVRIDFGTLRNWKLQMKLLFSKAAGSEGGISPFQTFCTVCAYRVAVGNVGGVCVAVMMGGPGAVFWMFVTALVTSAIAYAENCLGQVYKVRQDDQYRGGSYNYIESGLNMKPLAILFAILTLMVPVFVTGPGANNIAMAFENSLGLKPAVTGLIVGLLLFFVIAGGIKRIAKFSSVIVPIMTILYLGITVVVMVTNITKIPQMFALIFGSAFSIHAFFGGMFGSAVVYGVKRAVNSSGAGMGETVPSAAAAECRHPASQGIVNAFSVYVDVLVCLCSASLILITDCFNVVNKAGEYIYIGNGSSLMAQQAATNTAGIVWVQQAANSVIPNIGGITIAFCLLFFAFSTTVAYYYEGESALAYLFKGKDGKFRRGIIWALRIVMPIMVFVWSTVQAATAWSVSEVALGLLVWVNGIALIFLSNVAIKVYKDYMEQIKSGKEEPVFNPERLGIKNADIWMEINKDDIK